MSSLKHRVLKTIGKRRLSCEDWLQAAKRELVAKGIGAITVGRLARNLGASRPTFYWHFADRNELLHQLLRRWEGSNTRPFEEASIRQTRHLGNQGLTSIINFFVRENVYDPGFDLAVRDWARTSRMAAEALQRIDERRVNVLRQLFAEFGYPEPEALVRARITYFHQLGYYSTELREGLEARRALAPVYEHVLVGKTVEMCRNT